MTKAPRGVHQPSHEYDGRGVVETHGPMWPRRIILHDTECNDGPGTTEISGVANYWRGQGRGYGATLAIDGDGNTGRYANDDQITWHTGGANTGSLGIELIGFASFKTAGWYARPKQIRKLAQWLAWWSKRYEIPLVKSTDHGVSTHAMQSKIHPESEGHMDPGPGFPFWFVLKLARTYKRFGW